MQALSIILTTQPLNISNPKAAIPITPCPSQVMLALSFLKSYSDVGKVGPAEEARCC
jgi:hypothetical protein